MGTIHNLQYRWDDLNYLAGSAVASWLTFSHCTRTPLSWIEELEKAAISLVESTKRPIWICSSGGVDSETVCEIFLRLNLPFSVLTVEYAGGKNAHDVIYAKRWCAQNKVHQKIHTLDLDEFVNGELDDYIKRRICRRRDLPIHDDQADVDRRKHGGICGHSRGGAALSSRCIKESLNGG